MFNLFHVQLQIRMTRSQLNYLKIKNDDIRYSIQNCLSNEMSSEFEFYYSYKFTMEVKLSFGF